MDSRVWDCIILFIKGEYLGNTHTIFDASSKIERIGELREIKQTARNLVKKLKGYSGTNKKHAGLTTHNEYFNKPEMHIFQVYMFARFTIGFDPLTCEFADDIMQWTRHHNKQVPDTIPIFIKNDNCRNGYEILLVSVLRKLHGSASVEYDQNIMLKLHGNGPKALSSNLIAEEQLCHLIELTMHFVQTHQANNGGALHSPSELKAHYKEKFKTKTFNVFTVEGLADKLTSNKNAKKYWEEHAQSGKTDAESLKQPPLWKEYPEPNIEGIQIEGIQDDAIIEELAESVDDWNTKGERAWFEGLENTKYRDFYQNKWLVKRTALIRAYHRPSNQPF
ncbi:MAG: hypothetical protein BAJALOKI1v1_1300008 [Promethearchaeota archaeon]|nr:MAG: hypothetical protein BAJALOKI1v1_1300008 [Candidatus Lokiarchaeota archaeon]